MSSSPVTTISAIEPWSEPRFATSSTIGTASHPHSRHKHLRLEARSQGPLLRVGPGTAREEPAPDHRQLPVPDPALDPDSQPRITHPLPALVCRRMPNECAGRYNTTPVLIKIFVETPHHVGTTYQASGWTNVETIRGRGQYDRFNQSDAPKRTTG